jgi:hypothetical protein
MRVVSILAVFMLAACNRGATPTYYPTGALSYQNGYGLPSGYPQPTPYAGNYTYPSYGNPNYSNYGGSTYPSYNPYGTGSSYGLTCVLGHSGTTNIFPRGTWIFFNINTSTGEPVEVLNWDPGEPWSYAPTFPLYPPFSVSYATPGPKIVHVWARSTTSGAACNGGAPLEDDISIY